MYAVLNKQICLHHVILKLYNRFFWTDHFVGDVPNWYVSICIFEVEFVIGIHI